MYNDHSQGPDPTGGYVEYVPYDTAASAGLVRNGSDLVYLSVDKTNVYTPDGPGRPSVRLESKMTFTEGIFVIDLTHMPAGCGVWPGTYLDIKSSFYAVLLTPHDSFLDRRSR